MKGNAGLPRWVFRWWAVDVGTWQSGHEDSRPVENAVFSKLRRQARAARYLRYKYYSEISRLNRN